MSYAGEGLLLLRDNLDGEDGDFDAGFDFRASRRVLAKGSKPMTFLPSATKLD